MIMSKLTAAYLAGFVDGEGYISVLPYVRKDRIDQVYYKATFKVCSTNKEIIERFKASYGGYIYTRTPKKPNDNISYTWNINPPILTKILQAIRPYLKIKKRQAELVLKKIKLQEKGKEYSEEKNKILEDIYKELRVLNKRGKSLHAERLTEKTSVKNTEEVIV